MHRISTGLRPPPDPKLYEIPEPRTPKKPLEGEAEEVKLGEDGQPLPPPPPEPVLLERAMSTVLRTPYKPPPPTPEEIAKKEASDKEAAKLEAAKKGVKDDPKKQGLQKDAKGRTDAKSEKEDSKKGGGKKDGGKKGEYNKNEKKEAASKGAGKKGAADKKKGKKKKGAKDEKNDKPEVEEILPPPGLSWISFRCTEVHKCPIISFVLFVIAVVLVALSTSCMLSTVVCHETIEGLF